MSDDSTKQVKNVILQTTLVSAALGVVLSPIPLADELLLVPIYGVMAARIGRARNVALHQVRWKPIGTAIFAGLAARAAANLTVAFIPGVAAVANALSAAALTKVLGEYADTTCRNGEPPPMPFQKKGHAEPAASTEPAPV
jgi:uncharacterized protein (DUF697 family)